MDGWISVRNWRRHQHYDPSKRQPPWIKLYTDLQHDDAYLGLSLRLRGILVGIWLEYAESRCKLGSNPAQLGRRLGDSSVRARDIASLSEAGFITIVASAALAEGYHDASPHARPRAREETEEEKEKNPPTVPSPTASVAWQNGTEREDSDLETLDFRVPMPMLEQEDLPL